jgi:arabinan endo-1,5-alpha-L-arabinosidase
MEQQRERFWDMDLTKPLESIPEQTLDQVRGSWPEGDIAARCSDYMFRPHQHWTVTPVHETAGTLAGPLYKIQIAGTDRALTATADCEVTTRSFQNDQSQLWRIEQLTDGTYRIMPYVIPGQQGRNQHYCLYSAGDSTPTLAIYDFASDNSKWNFRK